MSVKFKVNFESLFERLADYSNTVIDGINAMFHNTFFRRDNYRDKFLFDIII